MIQFQHSQGLPLPHLIQTGAEFFPPYNRCPKYVYLSGGVCVLCFVFLFFSFNKRTFLVYYDEEVNELQELLLMWDL